MAAAWRSAWGGSLGCASKRSWGTRDGCGRPGRGTRGERGSFTFEVGWLVVWPSVRNVAMAGPRVRVCRARADCIGTQWIGQEFVQRRELAVGSLAGKGLAVVDFCRGLTVLGFVPNSLLVASPCCSRCYTIGHSQRAQRSVGRKNALSVNKYACSTLSRYGNGDANSLHNVCTNVNTSEKNGMRECFRTKWNVSCPLFYATVLAPFRPACRFQQRAGLFIFFPFSQQASAGASHARRRGRFWGAPGPCGAAV